MRNRHHFHLHNAPQLAKECPLVRSHPLSSAIRTLPLEEGLTQCYAEAVTLGEARGHTSVALLSRLKLAMAGVFTPQKQANTTNVSFCPPHWPIYPRPSLNPTPKPRLDFRAPSYPFRAPFMLILLPVSWRAGILLD